MGNGGFEDEILKEETMGMVEGIMHEVVALAVGRRSFADAKLA